MPDVRSPSEGVVTRSGYVILSDGEFWFDAGTVEQAKAFMEARLDA